MNTPDDTLSTPQILSDRDVTRMNRNTEQLKELREEIDTQISVVATPDWEKGFDMWYDRTQKIAGFYREPRESTEKQVSVMDRDCRQLFKDFIAGTLTQSRLQYQKELVERISERKGILVIDGVSPEEVDAYDNALSDVLALLKN